jgi:hypothetical protein
MLEGEEQVVFWSEDRHVIGDLRAEVRRLIAKRNLEEWKTQPSCEEDRLSSSESLQAGAKVGVLGSSSGDGTVPGVGDM